MFIVRNVALSKFLFLFFLLIFLGVSVIDLVMKERNAVVFMTSLSKEFLEKEILNSERFSGRFKLQSVGEKGWKIKSTGFLSFNSKDEVDDVVEKLKLSFGRNLLFLRGTDNSGRYWDSRLPELPEKYRSNKNDTGHSGTAKGLVREL